ncbi:phosphatase PAP2 family protein [Brevundimonas vesicularis]|uniref:phosphatase PAP2 family protein n=1 Tax=Brevundimonas vesicularis TaxID=41276 RepID=UPI0030C108CB
MDEPAETCFRPEPWVAASGSYPSGHSAMGWAWALALSEMAPDRADQILARGLAYGDSRAIYVSDVEGGRILGAARFAALKADPAFQANFATARLELARERRLAR